jgi:hypothetical protein
MSSAGTQSSAASGGEKKAEPPVVLGELISVPPIVPDGGFHAWATVAGSYGLRFAQFLYPLTRSQIFDHVLWIWVRWLQ